MSPDPFYSFCRLFCFQDNVPDRFSPATGPRAIGYGIEMAETLLQKG
jgi:hypothetical protein